MIQGRIDNATRELIEGWAWDSTEPHARLRLAIYDNGVKVATIRADIAREDLRQCGIGDGRHAFVWIFPESLSSAISHQIEVRCEPSGWTLPGIGAAIPAETATLSALHGSLDACDRHIVSGWARDSANPDTPVPLQILDGDSVLATVLANRFRKDLEQAGFGAGRHAFEVRLPGGLSPLEKHIIRVRHESDGREIPGSPFVIGVSDSFTTGLEEAVIKAIDALALEDDHDRVLSFLMAQTERLLEKHGRIEGGLAARIAYKEARRTSGPGGVQFADPGLRALVIDEDVPDVKRDAGSQAIMSHMHALSILGYSVTFVAAQDQSATDSAIDALKTANIKFLHPPFYPSVEDVLKWQRDCFDLVYLHRISNAEKYGGLARYYNRRARLIYSVADLHHLRIERQAKIEQRPELLAISNSLRVAECTAALFSNAVITHSSYEADRLHHFVPGAHVHVVPWEIPTREVKTPISDRHGVAFIAGFRHRPNSDAAWFLLQRVMPLVWQQDPTITLYLAGSYIPEKLRNLGDQRVQILGPVDDLQEVFDRVRLTVAPLRFGAGIKGKILNSFAAGIPCVMTPIGAEGLPLDGELQALVATNPEELAQKITTLHQEIETLSRLSAACNNLIRLGYSGAVTVASLKAAIAG